MFDDSMCGVHFEIVNGRLLVIANTTSPSASNDGVIREHCHIIQWWTEWNYKYGGWCGFAS